MVLALTAACGGTAAGRGLPDIGSERCPGNAPAPRSVPTPQPSSLPGLARLAAEEHDRVPTVVVHSGHGQPGPRPPIDVSGRTAAALAREVRAASEVACALRTPEAAARAGYVLSSNYDEGVGAHWTNWNLVDAPFDPTRPAMLLFGPRLGVTQLVGFSYWVRTAEPDGPAGYAGAADEWHRHYGLCFDRTGMLQRENVRSALLCNGIYLDGADLWMLHAWVVPGAANVWGLFAPLNPQLCRRAVADIARCPEPSASPPSG